MFIIDAHLDVAFNAFNFGRDFTASLEVIRERENGRSANGIATVSLPALLEAGVGLAFGTIFATHAASPFAAQMHPHLLYETPEQAHSSGMRQLDFYHRLTDEVEQIRLLQDEKTLDEVLASHQQDETVPLFGFFLLMEGADSIREPEELELWVERGLRLVAPALDDTRYADGAWRERGGLTKDGYGLLEMMQAFGVGLDISHLSEKGFYEALDNFDGVAIASHSNCRALVPGERQLSNRQIIRLGEQGGVVGIALFNGFLKAQHQLGDAKELVTLDHVVAHIDHVCQLLGSSEHVGIGSDLDGGFGAKDIPCEMDGVIELPLIAKKLTEYGYSEQDVANIMGENWLRVVRQILS
ncbi:MAG: membrane dipeptidase [Chloroflexota bacterium]